MKCGKGTGAWRVGCAGLCAFWLAACTPTRPAATTRGLSGSATPATERPRAEQGPVHGLDQSAFEKALDASMDQVLARPKVDHAFEALIQSVLDDPALSAHGETMFTSLGDDPALKARLAALQESLGDLPELTALSESLQAAHPNADAAELGALIERHMDSRIESKAFDQALDGAIESQFARPELTRVFDDFGKIVSENEHVIDGITAALRGVDEQRWQRRLSELNGGTPPDEARSLELLSTHVFNADRLEQLLLEWLQQPSTRAELVRFCGELLDAPEFRRHAVVAAAQLLDDPGFSDGALRSFGLLVAPQLDERALTQQVQRTLDSRRIAATLEGFFRALFRDPGLAQVGNRSLARLATGPSLAGPLQRFVNDW